MAQQFKILGQNLSYNLPEENEVFRTTGDYGTRLFKRTGQGIQGIDVIKDVLGADLSKQGSGYGTTGDAAKAGLAKLQSQYNIDYGKLPQYNVDETLQTLGKISGQFRNPQYIND